MSQRRNGQDASAADQGPSTATDPADGTSQLDIAALNITGLDVPKLAPDHVDQPSESHSPVAASTSTPFHDALAHGPATETLESEESKPQQGPLDASVIDPYLESLPPFLRVVPTEVWVRIASHLTFRDARNFAASAHALKFAGQTRIWRTIKLVQAPETFRYQLNRPHSKEDWHTHMHKQLLNLFHTFKRSRTRALGQYVRELVIDHRISTSNSKLFIELVELVAPSVTSLTILPREPHTPRSVRNQGHQLFFDFLIESADKKRFGRLRTLKLTIDTGVSPDEIVIVVQSMQSLKTLDIKYNSHPHGQRLVNERKTSLKVKELDTTNLTSFSFSGLMFFPEAFYELFKASPFLSAVNIATLRRPPMAAQPSWRNGHPHKVLQVVAGLAHLTDLSFSLSTIDFINDHMPDGGFATLRKLTVPAKRLASYGWRPERFSEPVLRPPFPSMPTLQELILIACDSYGSSLKIDAHTMLAAQSQKMSKTLSDKLQKAPALQSNLVRSPHGEWVTHAGLPYLAQATIIRGPEPHQDLMGMNLLTRAVPKGSPIPTLDRDAWEQQCIVLNDEKGRQMTQKYLNGSSPVLQFMEA